MVFGTPYALLRYQRHKGAGTSAPPGRLKELDHVALDKMLSRPAFAQTPPRQRVGMVHRYFSGCFSQVNCTFHAGGHAIAPNRAPRRNSRFLYALFATCHTRSSTHCPRPADSLLPNLPQTTAGLTLHRVGAQPGLDIDTPVGLRLAGRLQRPPGQPFLRGPVPGPSMAQPSSPQRVLRARYPDSIIWS